MFKAGDKVEYIGEDRPKLYIKRGKEYTVSKVYESFLQLEEIEEVHSYSMNKFKKINKETVDHPNHYNIGGIEVIDFIESWNLGFSLGNAIKYIARAPYKNNELEDLKKARWYIDREIQRLEKNTNK